MVFDKNMLNISHGIVVQQALYFCFGIWDFFLKNMFLFIMYLRTLILMTTCFRILMRKRYHTSIVCITRLLDRHLTVVLHKTSILNVNCHIIQACKWLHYMCIINILFLVHRVYIIYFVVMCYIYLILCIPINSRLMCCTFTSFWMAQNFQWFKTVFKYLKKKSHPVCFEGVIYTCWQCSLIDYEMLYYDSGCSWSGHFVKQILQ